MSTNIKSTRWLLLATHFGTIIFMVACTAVGTGTQTTDDGSIQVEDGVIEVQNEDGDWVPIAGESAFELVGELEDTEPWTVGGKTLETNETTQIEKGLQIGDLVRARGTVLEDGTWLAYSIELAEEQTDPIVVLIGVVDSVDPWSVNGIELNVTDETDIQGDIDPGMIVRVEVLLLEDGTWEVLSIAPLGETTETTGCLTVVATIVSVEGNNIQFLGWPTTVTLNLEDEEQRVQGDGDENGTTETTLEADQVVSAVVCVSEDGQLIIIQITLLDNENEGESDSDGSGNGEKVLICHKPDKNAHTLSVASSAVPAHLGHGDTLGACP